MGRWAVVLLMLASVAFSQDAQQAVTLQAKPGTLGEKTEIRVESSLDLDIIIKDSEPERTSQLSLLKSERFTQEVTAVEDGTSAAKVTCVASELQRSGTNLPLRKETTPLQGRVFFVKRAAGASTVEMLDRSEVPAGAEGVGGWEEFGRLLPAKEVRAGDQWVIEKDVSALFSVANLAETKAAALTGALKSVEGEMATIAFTGALEGKTRDGSSIKLTIAEGELLFNVLRGRPQSIRIAGGLEMTKDVIYDYQPPGSIVKVPEKVGEVRTKSRKLEVRITYQ